jgi:hypothetical protein
VGVAYLYQYHIIYQCYLEKAEERVANTDIVEEAALIITAVEDVEKETDLDNNKAISSIEEKQPTSESLPTPINNTEDNETVANPPDTTVGIHYK